ncbi:cytochrome P450 [Streptomyces blastmyceticus]|uniref:Cytochrome P450 n=1 Tax=Streptomyces blastmyceticus TaxID=68180 RepID=A0ABN0WFP1_9ACTN
MAKDFTEETGQPDRPPAAAVTAEGAAGRSAVFPMPRACPFSPPLYAEAGARHPVCRVTLADGRRAWMVTDYAYARQLLADHRTSSNRDDVRFPPPVAVVQGRPDKGNLVSMDPPEHTVHRRLLAGEFTAGRMRALRPRVQEIVDNRVTRMLSSPSHPVDLVQEFARPVAALVICAFLGIPAADREVFQEDVATLVDNTVSAGQRKAARDAVDRYLAGHIATRECGTDDDLLSRLIARYRQAGRYDREVLVRLANLFLFAGHENSANMIALGVVALLRSPDQLAALAGNPAMAPRAVEELLRYLSIADQITRRVALADIELGGALIRAGEAVIVSNAAANYDDKVFSEPSALDLRREARHHLAFGYGIHQCIGQHLVRLELEVALTTLLARIPRLRLAVPADQLRFRTDTSTAGVHAAPVTW